MSTIEEPVKIGAVVRAWHNASEEWCYFMRDAITAAWPWRGRRLDLSWDEITDPDTFTNVTIVFPGKDYPPPPPLAEPTGLRAMVVIEWPDDTDRTLVRFPNTNTPDSPWVAFGGARYSWAEVRESSGDLRIVFAGEEA